MSRPSFKNVLRSSAFLCVVGLILWRVLFTSVSVNVCIARPQRVIAEVMGTGTLEARFQTTVSSKITGRLVDLLADQNDRVKKGQLLGVLDDAQFRQEVQIASASLAAARAADRRADADIRKAEATARRARQDFERNDALRKTDTISPLELDKSAEDLNVSAAEMDRARAAKVEADRQVVAAEETLRYQEARLEDTRLISPFDGMVIRRIRQPGEVVVPGSDVLQLVSTERLWVSAWVDESAMSRLAPGEPARIVFRSEPDRPYAGKVVRLSPQTDRETREFLVDVEVVELPRVWAIGQRAEVFIETARKEDALALPQAAIVWREGAPGVFVEEDGRARWRKVTLGVRSLDSVEVIDGLRSGDAAITSPDPGALVEGRTIRLP